MTQITVFQLWIHCFVTFNFCMSDAESSLHVFACAICQEVREQEHVYLHKKKCVHTCGIVHCKQNNLEKNKLLSVMPCLMQPQ